jgi:class 3 adenylate cyclase/tetratricopeptide (TPR) repeat protein
VVRCDACGEGNPGRARFCLACGAPLAAEPERQREERKLVSVLFCDLVGFTARSDNADPEDVRATLRPYHARLRKDIERFGGTVEKFIGDAVMAVFGAPVGHEDDAERAVRSALRIAESIGELNEDSPGLDLAVRVGVNTGEAVVALGARPEQGEGMVTGDVVNTAARLQTIAPVNGVVVGEVTYRATKDVVDYEHLDPVTVKGKAGPIPIWRAVAARSRFGVDVEQGTRTPFIGRANELALVIQTFARTVQESSVQLITITGEPGAGKTRLLWELRRHLDDQPDLVYWRQGRCLPYGEGVTYWALGEMVKGQAGILESDSPEEAAAKIEAAVIAVMPDDAEREWMLSRLAPLVGSTGTEGERSDREESFAAWVRFLESIAIHHPLVLLFEDLHWADQPLREFVEHLVDWATGVPLLVVCSARPELYELHPGWGGGKRNSTTISLAPLSEADTARLISAMLEQAVLPAEVQAELLDRAGGNPLYAEEFIRMLTDRGILDRRGASLHIAAPASGIPLPETVQALIGARLDTLSADRKSLLQDASVLGKVFWLGALATMSGRDERPVREALHELASKELVRAIRNTSVQDQAEYSFWHALVRDVAYGQIPRVQRAGKHLAAAAWIEGIAGDRIEDLAEFLAHHYELALDLTVAAGGKRDDGLRLRAVHFLAMAGDRASALDMSRALTFYRGAEARSEEGDADLPTLRVKLLEAASNLGEATSAEMEEAYQRAIAHLRTRGDTLLAGDMQVRYALFLSNIGQTERSERTNDEAIGLLEPLGPTRELALAYNRKSGSHMLAGRFPEWNEWTERTLTLARSLQLRDVEARTLQYRGIFRIITGDLKGREDLEEALRLALQLGLGNATASAYTNLADWVSRTEGPAEGLAIYEEGIRFAQRRGLGSQEMWMRAESTWRLFDVGRWDEVIPVTEQIRRWFEGRGMGTPVVMAATQEALVRARRGELERAGAIMSEMLPEARQIGDVQTIRPAINTAALIALEQGDGAAALSLLDEFEREIGSVQATGYGMFDAVLLSIALGDVDRAERIADPGEPGVPGYRWGRLTVLSSRAQVDAARGRHDEALRSFQTLAEEWGQMQHVFDRALALLGAARSLAALGRAAQATQPAREASRVFQSLGARSLSHQAGELAGGAAALGS